MTTTSDDNTDRAKAVYNMLIACIVSIVGRYLLRSKIFDGFDLSGGEMSDLGLVLDKKLGFTLGF